MKRNKHSPGYLLKHGINQHLFENNLLHTTQITGTKMDTNMNTPGYVSKHGINQHLFKCVQPRAQKQRTSHETKMNAKMILKHAHSGLRLKTWNKSTPFRIRAAVRAKIIYSARNKNEDKHTHSGLYRKAWNKSTLFQTKWDTLPPPIEQPKHSPTKVQQTKFKQAKNNIIINTDLIKEFGINILFKNQTII